MNDNYNIGEIGITTYGDLSSKINNSQSSNINGFLKEMKKQIVQDINGEYVSLRKFLKMKLTQHNNKPDTNPKINTIEEFITIKKEEDEGYNNLIAEYKNFNNDVKNSNNYKKPFSKEYKPLFYFYNPIYLKNGGKKKNTRKKQTKKHKKNLQNKKSKNNYRRKTKKTT